MSNVVELAAALIAAGNQGGVFGTTSGKFAEGNHSHDVAVPTGEGQKDGFISHADKLKLNGIEAGAKAAGEAGDAHAVTAHAPSDAQKNVQTDWNATEGDALLLNKPSSMAPSSHNHPLSEITDNGDAAGKNVGTGANDVAAGNHSHTDLHTRQHSMTSGDDHQMATARMVGRTTASTGAPEELTAANVRDFISVEENASAFSGKKVVGINPQTGTTYTLVLADAGKYIRMNNANAIALTVPLNADVAFEIGTVITGIQIGAGVITVGGADVTLNKFEGLKTAGQYAWIQLIKVDTNTWDVGGGVE